LLPFFIVDHFYFSQFLFHPSNFSPFLLLTIFIFHHSYFSPLHAKDLSLANVVANKTTTVPNRYVDVLFFSTIIYATFFDHYCFDIIVSTMIDF